MSDWGIPIWRRWRLLCGVLAISLLSACAGQRPNQAAALPSWNDGPSRRAIVEFVRTVTTPGATGYVAEADRVAVFDNDGTLWSEQPAYFELLFSLDRVK